MKISSKPGDYSGAFAKVLYRIEDADPNQTTEIQILEPDRNDCIAGIKRLFGNSNYTINVANYYRKHLDPQPFFSSEIILDTPPGRHTNASFKAGEVESGNTILTAGSVTGRECEFLSGSPSRLNISPEEYDELSFFAPGRTLTANISLTGKAGVKTIRTTTFTCGSGIYTYILNMRDLSLKVGDLADYSLLCVDFIERDMSIMRKEYDIRPHIKSSVRLCWLNKFGCIDYYTFSPVQASVYRTDKGKLYSREGYELSYSEAETLHSIVSDCEPTEIMEWLSEIISSPKVWIVKSERLNNITNYSDPTECFTRVDILTKKVNTYDEKPCVLPLTLRAKKKKTFQNG